MVGAMLSLEFAALDAVDVRNWFEDRARNALEIADRNAGADVITNDGEFIKVYALIVLMMWFRWTFPRLRFDQLMKFAWVVLVPLSLINLLITTLILKIV